ncbi:anaerobic sulfatase maturase [Chitinilyticum litopenaei]|uniref:anaerobic sulfatase maturase n=1 Tax=Chitinilyticum litopenaei TaxID=1121276 RepID=UPI000420548C|nr:anaerobic sulfatase maturase [Chitinilyticum litopenaei]
MIPIHPLDQDPRLTLPALEEGDFYAFHVMIKPAGAQCNLDCAYCFYLHKEDLLQQGKLPRMSESLLEAHIRQYIAAQTGPEVVFTWQGGEPTLMGLDFFRRVVELQARHAKPGQAIANDLQTNGILLDDEWCAFLKQHRFLVGLSIDGPAALHDAYRYSKGGKPTFERVMAAVQLLHRHAITFNALCVVNRLNARKPIDVYRFLRDEVRPRIIQFLPAVEPVSFRAVAPGYWNPDELPVSGSPRARPGQPDSVVADWSVDPEDWGYFLTRVWEEWLKRDFGRVFVDQFENVISQLLGRGAQNCVSGQICGKALAIEHDGSLYSCDHFVYPEYRLGHIREVHEGDMAFSERQQAFGFAKYQTLPAYCRGCRYLQLCWGECPKNRFVKTPDGEAGLNYLCPGLKKFYARIVADRAVFLGRMGMSTGNCII